MTRELLQEANKLSHAISTLEEQIAIVEDMHHCDNSINIHCSGVGTVTISDNELKDDIIDMVLNRLNKAKDDAEDKLRLL